MGRYLFARVVEDLPHQWEIHINPDGTRSFYFRPDLVMTEAIAALINDLAYAHHDNCKTCNEIVWVYLGLQVGTGQADVLVRLISQATGHGRHLTITGDGIAWHPVASGHESASLRAS